MTAPAIEVTRRDDGWRWAILSERGRPLVESEHGFDCDLAAFNDGKAWRAAFMRGAALIDREAA
jgi:hypothetical protein